MIFKYFGYEKKNKQWIDTKSYYSICMPNTPLSKRDLSSLLYKAMRKHRIIDFGAENFLASDYSSKLGLAYTLYYVTTINKKTLGKLVQLPSREHAVPAKPRVDGDIFPTKPKKPKPVSSWDAFPINNDVWIQAGGNQVHYTYQRTNVSLNDAIEQLRAQALQVEQTIQAAQAAPALPAEPQRHEYYAEVRPVVDEHDNDVAFLDDEYYNGE